MRHKKLVLRSGGMFSNVNEVVHHLYLADRRGYQFVIDWSSSSYADADRPGDPWTYFFEDVFSENDFGTDDLEVLPHGDLVVLQHDNIITPRASWYNDRMLILPTDRQLPHQYIDRHIRLKPEIQQIIDQFEGAYFGGDTIGLHIRGPGRNHGGADKLRSNLTTENGIPYGQYFKFVDKELAVRPHAGILLCSDSLQVLERVKATYGDRVFWYGASRTQFGEMHERREMPENAAHTGYKLGMDILVEAFLLTRTNVFVHGNSNVANFVVCANPGLKNIYVYEGIRPVSRTAAVKNRTWEIAQRLLR